MLSGAFGACLVAGVEALWASAHVVFLSTLLLLPFAIMASLVAECATGAGLATLDPRKVLAVSLAAVVATAGTYASNTLLVTGPTSPLVVCGYVLAIGMALVSSGLLSRALRTARGQRLLRNLGPQPILGAVALLFSVGASVVDATFYTGFYRAEHVGLAAVALIAACLAATVVLRLPWKGRGATFIGLMWLVAICLQGTWSIDHVSVEILHHPTVHRRLWLAARGKARESGVMASYPKPTPPPTAPYEVTSPSTPRTVVLVTMDAFRCGFGRGDRSELRDACPTLTRLLGESASRLDAHAVSPSTLVSTKAMQTVMGMPLGDALRQAGFDTTVIATHPRIIESPEVRASFDVVDEILGPIARRGIVPTSVATTRRALDVLDSMSADRSHYLWVHYFDAHAPYVKDVGSPWRISDIDSYAAEVRRVDAAVGELVASVKANITMPITIVITADHGEEFGEHGVRTHGGNLYEPALRIPVIVWTNDPTGRRKPPSELPSDSGEIGAFLLALGLDRSFATKGFSSIFASSDDDVQEGVVSDGWKLIAHRTLGYRELYDLRRDPAEANDLWATETSVRERIESLLPSP